MTFRKAPLFCALLLLAIAVDFAAACGGGSSGGTGGLPPPPGTTTSISSSSGMPDAGSVNLCGVAASLSQPACVMCNMGVLGEDGGSPVCNSEQTACASDDAGATNCLNDIACVAGCVQDAGVACVACCVQNASPQYIAYITCIGENCPACQAQGTACDLGDAGADGGACSAAADDAGDGGCPGETDVGCGGPSCPACMPGMKCMKGSDCSSGVCTGGQCVAPTCSDGVQNEMETDIDCGGPHCPACVPGKHCMITTDCNSLVCTGDICQPPSCSDDVKNEGESDVDCGGPCPRCNPGQTCNNPNDCKGGNCAGAVCQCPTGMIVSPILAGGIYCIDAVEVTYTQYQAFYAANPPIDTQVSYCSWNTSWTPTADWPADQANQFFPVNYVNWCQAYGFCQYGGKRLCGKINGKDVATDAGIDDTQDEWFNACTAQGANVYPYGNTFSATACNYDNPETADGGMGGPWSQQVHMSCLGGIPGLFDMSGNLAEWEDSCSAMTGASDQCLVRGGSFESTTQDEMLCSAIASDARNYVGPDVGFRCCL